MGIKHSTQTAKANNPDYDVSADAWNEDHDIDGNVDFDQNESLNHRAENLDSLPTPTVSMFGRLAFLSPDKRLCVVVPV